MYEIENPLVPNSPIWRMKYGVCSDSQSEKIWNLLCKHVGTKWFPFSCYWLEPPIHYSFHTDPPIHRDFRPCVAFLAALEMAVQLRLKYHVWNFYHTVDHMLVIVDFERKFWPKAPDNTYPERAILQYEPSSWFANATPSFSLVSMAPYPSWRVQISIKS